MNTNPPPEKHRILLLNFYSVLNTKGGAEHVMSKMANAFVERGHAVKIVFLQNAAGEPAYPLDARVELENCAKIRCLGDGEKRCCVFAVGSFAIKTAEKPFAAIEWIKQEPARFHLPF